MDVKFLGISIRFLLDVTNNGDFSVNVTTNIYDFSILYDSNSAFNYNGRLIPAATFALVTFSFFNKLLVFSKLWI